MPDIRAVKVDGVIEEALPGLLFRVKLFNEKDETGEPKVVLAHMGGKMKMYRIRVVPGDRVTVEMPNIKDTRGRIIRRL
ncbi:MAG: translation initiation factor IF-1 [bacterium]|nr:translation initiation factor IF-1 [bacterium]